MPVSEEKNIAVVCNPLAGSGSAVKLTEKIIAALTERKIQFSVFREAWPERFDDFTDTWIVGGDGTLNYFVNHYPAIRIPLVIFNGGTGNDFHWLLYGNKTFEEQLELVLTAPSRPIDLGSCNEKFFINGVGVGFEGAVAKSLTGKKKKAGKASFMAMVLKKIFSYRSMSYQIKTGEGFGITKKYLIIDISNGSRAGGGFHIAPAAKADDGLFDLVLIDAISSLKRLRWLPVIEKGKHSGLSFIQTIKTANVIVESNQLIQSHLDGEYYSAERLEITILPGRLLFRF